MGEPKGTIIGAEEPDAEVELTAQELRELSKPRDSNKERPFGPIEGATVPLAPTTAEPSASAAQTHTAAEPARHTTISGRFLSITLVLGAIGALYFVTASNDDPAQPRALRLAQGAPRPVPSQPEPEVSGQPVLFTNPFDPQEVFEFPAGTPEGEAREAVAQMLLERAVERQRHLDTLVTKNH